MDKQALHAAAEELNNIDKIIKAVVDYVKDNGGKPFIIPAMGSHGGATAEGQKHVVKSLE